MRDEHRMKMASKVWVLGDGLRLYECPLSFITAETNDIITQVYRTEESKRLLFSGEWADQPYWFVEAMDIFKGEQARRAKREHGERPKA